MIIYIAVINIVTNLCLATLVFLRNRRHPVNILVVIFILLLTLWTVANTCSLLPVDAAQRLFWVRAVMFVTTPIPLVFFLIAYFFPNKPEKVNRVLLVFLTAVTACVLLLTPTSLMFSSYSFVGGKPSLTPGPAAALYGLNFSMLSLAAFLSLVSKYRNSMGRQKAQVFFVVLGLILTVALGFSTNFLAVVVWNNLSMVALGPSFSLILVIFLTYAIVKHRLLDIKFVIVRSFGYLFFMSTVALLYIGGLFLLGEFFTEQQRDTVDVVYGVIVSVFAALTFQPLRRFIEKLTEKVFFRNAYDARKLLHELAHIASTNIVLQELISLFLKKLQQEMKFSSLTLVIPGSQNAVFSTDKKNLTREAEKGFYLLSSDFSSVRKILLFSEVPESDGKEMARKYGLMAALDLRVGEKLMGTLFLGEKSSGDDFTLEDLSVLEILCPQLSIAVKNALSYDEISTFNQKLEQEVARATRKLQKTNATLRQLDRLKDEFVTIASHELRTPLTAIKSYLWLSLQGSSTLSNEVRQHLEIAYASSERLIHLVKNMLMISRIEGNHFGLKLKSFNVIHLISQVKEELQVKADERKIRFIFNPTTKKVNIIADQEKIREVLQNIIGNALKFTPVNGKVSVEVSHMSLIVGIKVIDSGPGINKKDQQKLFQKFSRIEHSYQKMVNSGTGLGLYISQQIIQLHSGSIQVTSSKKSGTSFSIQLPVN